jgi:hypothetical protein
VHIGNLDHPGLRKLNHSASERDLRKYSDDTFERFDLPDPDAVDEFGQQTNKSLLSPRAETFLPRGHPSQMDPDLRIEIHDMHDVEGDMSFPSDDHFERNFPLIEGEHGYDFGSYGLSQAVYASSTSPISPYPPHYLPLAAFQRGFSDHENGPYYPGASLSPPPQHPHRLSVCSSNGSDHTVVGHPSSSGSASSTNLVNGRVEDGSRVLASIREPSMLGLGMLSLHSSIHGAGQGNNGIPPRNALDLDKIERGEDTRTVSLFAKGSITYIHSPRVKTIMLKNIPNKMSDRDLIQFINNVISRKVDFLYLRHVSRFRNQGCILIANVHL